MVEVGTDVFTGTGLFVAVGGAVGDDFPEQEAKMAAAMMMLKTRWRLRVECIFMVSGLLWVG